MYVCWMLFLLLPTPQLEPQIKWTLSLADLEIFPHAYATNLLAFADDGALLLMDSGSRQLVFTDAWGKLKRRVGKPGRGPGEFSIIAAVGWSRQGFFTVMDRHNQRVSTFDKEGALLKEYPARDLFRQPVFGEGTQLFCLKRQGKQGFESLVLSYDWQKGTSVSLYKTQMEPIATWMHWNPKVVFTPGRTFLVVNNGTDAEIRLIDPADGKKLASWMLEVPRIPLTEEFLAAYKEDFLRRTGASSKGGSGPRPQFVTDEYWPWTDNILVDERDRIWVFLHRVSNQATTRFFIFDKRGEKLHEGALTGKVQALREGTLFVIQRDAQGEDQLSKYHYSLP